MSPPDPSRTAAREALADSLAERTIGREHGSIETLNLILAGTASADCPCGMPDELWHWLLTIDHAVPVALRNGLPWKSALAAAATAGPCPVATRLQPAIDAAWAALDSLDGAAAAQGVKQPWHNLLEQRSLPAANAVVDVLPVAAGTTGNAFRYAARSTLGFIDELPRLAKDPSASRRAADYLAMTLIDACPGGKGSKAYWQRIDPPAVLRAMAHATAKTA